MVIRKKAAESEAVIQKIETLLFDLQIDYKNISHYILSFVHRSIVNEKPDYTPEHNERLEFLGDAVLELVVTDNLFHDYPEKAEGELTDIRSSIVRGRNLAVIAKKLHFWEYLLLGKGEDLGGGRENDYILANTVEAFLGAIYVDLGPEEARNFVETHIYPTVHEILDKSIVKDYKTAIQELVQAQMDVTPTYKVLKNEGPDHSKIFTVWIYFWEQRAAQGEGKSKKKAQEDAAKNAYLQLTSTL